ncbi:MAG: phosphate/phosphite/phosphonate ABC transporter substrate-binding protein [Verrucomicrobiota bacterium]
MPSSSYRFFAPFILLVALFWSAACSPDRIPQSESLKLGYVPSDPATSDRKAAFEALRDYLESRLETQVELVQTSSYQPAINAMKNGEIDILNFGSYAYLIAENEANAEAFAARGRPDGAPYDYQSLIITHRDAPWKTIEEALGQASELKVCFTNKASTSGYLIPKAFIASQGLNPENEFAETRYSNSHVLSILQTAQGQFDLATVSSNSLDDLISSKKIDPHSIRILWRSAAIPNGPVAYRKDLDAELKQQIRETYYTAHLAEPAIWTTIKTQYPNRDFIYIPATPNDFRDLTAQLAK